MNMKFVFNQKGFLLLEHLIAIAIMGIISISFLSVMQVISSYAADQNTLTMHEVNTVAVRLQNEVRFADFFITSPGRLDVHFANSNDVINFFVLNNRLVRRVNGLGGEVVVHNVTSMDVLALADNSVRIVLHCLAGQEFSFSLSILQLNIYFVAEEKYDEEGDDYEYLEE